MSDRLLASTVLRPVLCLVIALQASSAWGDGLTADRLAVLYDRDDPASVRIARYYADRRHVPAANVIGLAVPERAVISRAELAELRDGMLERLPSTVQSLLLVWSRPYAVECMSITTAMTAGYRPAFCEPGCGLTLESPLYDLDEWLPTDTVGWLPAMLLPSDDETLARAVIDRGIRADGTHPNGTVYLIRTPDLARNVRSAEYGQTQAAAAGRIVVEEKSTPITSPLPDAIAYFTGTAWVKELPLIEFRPGAAADHLTSTGGTLAFGRQMSVLAWLKAGATASYGAVSEPCNHLRKFPNTAVFLRHYLRGDSLLEAYWKSVAMPGQGLIVGEPLARPFGGSGHE